MNRLEELEAGDDTILDAYDKMIPQQEVVDQLMFLSMEDDDGLYQDTEFYKMTVQQLRKLKKKMSRTRLEFEDRFERVVDISRRLSTLVYGLDDLIKKKQRDETPEH